MISLDRLRFVQIQVILGTFQLDRKKDAAGSSGKGDASNSGSRLTSPTSTGPLLGMGFRSGMDTSGRNPMRGNDEHHHHHQTGLGGPHHFMMQGPQGMHMTHSRPEWGGGGNSGRDSRGGGGYDLSGKKRSKLSQKMSSFPSKFKTIKSKKQQITIEIELKLSPLGYGLKPPLMYSYAGRIGHESSENGDYEQQIPD